MEVMTELFPKSPEFVFRAGAKVIPLGSNVNAFYVLAVDGDRVRISLDGREGDARTSELVAIDRAEDYFTAQIQANPQFVYGYVMRAIARYEKHELVKARIRL